MGFLEKEIDKKVLEVSSLGFSFHPDPYNWLFEFACQYLEKYHRIPSSNAMFIPQIMYSKLSDIQVAGEASSSLNLHHIPLAIDDMKRFDVKPVYLPFHGRQPYK